MKKLELVMDGCWRWTWFSEEKGMNFNGWALRLPEAFVLVDPAYAGEEAWKELEALGRPSAVLLSNKDHERASDELRRRFKIAVWAHEEEARLLALPPERTFRDGERLFGALEAWRFHGFKSPAECAFYWRGRRLLLVGDAVTGHPAGKAGVVKKHQGDAKVLAELGRLLELDFDALLVGDGEPFKTGGKPALRALLSAGN